jgi:hypothetical protein
MVWPITGAECYVRGTRKSMKAVELAVAREDGWRKIAIELNDLARHFSKGAKSQSGIE